MNIFLKIAVVFFKVGLLTIGGGLAMIPVIQQEMTRLGWLNTQQFLDILGIAQMTPGPFSVNTATFVGYRVIADYFTESPWLGLIGALVGTISVCLPSLICINLLGAFWWRNRSHPCMTKVFDILRPLVTGLIITAAIRLGMNCLGSDTAQALFSQAPKILALMIMLAAFALTAFKKSSPVLVLAGGLGLGFLCRMAGG